MGKEDNDVINTGGEMSEAEIDYNLMETFPASDPPSWTSGIGPNRKPHEQFEGETPSPDDPSHQNQSVEEEE